MTTPPLPNIHLSMAINGDGDLMLRMDYGYPSNDGMPEHKTCACILSKRHFKELIGTGNRTIVESAQAMQIAELKREIVGLKLDIKELTKCGDEADKEILAQDKRLSTLEQQVELIEAYTNPAFNNPIDGTPTELEAF